MPKRLSDDQIARYHADGFVHQIDIFTPDEVGQIVADLLDAEERFPDQLDAAGRNNVHYVVPALDRVAHDARILDAVEDLIGPDILVCGTTLFIKDPETKGFISWHQDARYIGLEPHDWVTAWVALGDVSFENGCMQMIPGSHVGPLKEHEDTFGEDNLLTRGQSVPDVDVTQAVPVEMRAGQLSLHHPRVVHGSGPNLSKRRRLGFAIQSYIAPNVDQVIGKNWVQLARGEDKYQHHPVTGHPSGLMHPDEIAFRDMTNDELSKIFYQGAPKKGRY